MERTGNFEVIEAESDFKRVHKSIIENSDIDCQTLGVFVRMLILGKKWNLNINGLSSHLKLSDTKIRASIKELEKFGYITRHAVKGDNGKFIGWNYKLYPIPSSEKTQAGLRTCQKTDTPHLGQDGLRTTPITDNTENREENNNRLKEPINLKKEETKSTITAEAETPSWRTDFNAYTTLVYQAKEKLLYDAEYKAQKEKFHSNIDYALSLEKAVFEYWGTEKAWEHKKKSKSKVIDMVSTLKKAFDISSNRVYKKLQYGKPVESGFKKDIPKNKNFTFIPLNQELKFVDEEGKLNDGTFVKEGYRFYFSAKEGRSCSIPPATEPMPKSVGCEYDGNLGWYEID